MTSNRENDLLRSGQGIDGNTVAENLAFNSQCFLIQNMFNIAQRVKMCYEQLRVPPTESLETNVPLQGHRYSNSTFKAIVPVVSDNDITAGVKSNNSSSP
tara:strand:+ start:404 stop:703 length:300 start_codon:yes stop_codon:yes gene_type:complete